MWDLPRPGLEPVSPALAGRFFFFLFNEFIFISFILFLAMLVLRCCARAFSGCGEQGLLFVVVRRLLIAVASRCGAWALGAQASVVVAHGL